MNEATKIIFRKTSGDQGERTWDVLRDGECLGIIEAEIVDGSSPTSYAFVPRVDGYTVSDWRDDSIETKFFCASKYGTARKALAEAKRVFKN